MEHNSPKFVSSLFTSEISKLLIYILQAGIVPFVEILICAKGHIQQHSPRARLVYWGPLLVPFSILGEKTGPGVVWEKPKLNFFFPRKCQGTRHNWLWYFLENLAILSLHHPYLYTRSGCPCSPNNIWRFFILDANAAIYVWVCEMYRKDYRDLQKMYVKDCRDYQEKNRGTATFQHLHSCGRWLLVSCCQFGTGK